MPTIMQADGQVLVDRLDVATASCPVCAAEGFGFSGLIAAGSKAVDLNTFTSVGVIPEQVSCTSCGATVEWPSFSALFFPDEEDLPALAWKADLNDDGTLASEPEWFLVHVPPPHKAKFPDVLGGALLAADERIEPLERIDEEILVERWGRPFSMREYWRMLFAKTARPGQAGIYPLAPGMSAFVGRPPEGSVDDAAAWMGEQAEEMKRYFKLEAPGDDSKLAMIPLSMGAADVEGFTHWAGPWAGEIGVTLLVFVLLDHDVVAEEIAKACARLEIEAAEVPEGPSHWEAMAGQDEANSVRQLWLKYAGVRFSIASDDIAAYAALRAATVAEAAAQLLSGRRDLCRLVAACTDNLRGYLGGKAEVEIWAADEVRVTREGKTAVVNFPSMLSKFGWDPDHPQIAARSRQLLEQWPLSPESDIDEMIAKLCDCDERWHFRHLRPADFLAGQEDAPERKEFVDAVGQEFGLFAALECPHMVSWWTAGLAGALDDPAQLKRWLREGEDLVQFQLDVTATRNVAGEVTVLRLDGPNVATIATYKGLSANLVRQLRERFALPGRMFAFAPTTDLMFVAQIKDDRGLSVQSAYTQFQSDTGTNPKGAQLFMLSELSTRAKPKGKITLSWD